LAGNDQEGALYMTATEMLKITTKLAKEYANQGDESVIRNRHMNQLGPDESIDQRVIEALVVDFINFIGIKHGIDYCLYTSDLRRGGADTEN
jgi:hypothetical protein